jgi:three-Cys-motif partner protein
MTRDNIPTVWPAEPHTLAKHAVLERYLNAWLPILSRQSGRVQSGSREILFIDGFAGPGEYTGGELGSPIIALKAALGHSVPFPVPVRLLFIEAREDRYLHLKGVLDRYSEQVGQSNKVRLSEPRQGECDLLLREVLDKCEQNRVRFGPALAFLDQFGYSAVSMELIKRILEFPQCEVFSYLDYKDMNRWIVDPSKASSFTRTYGGDEWQQAIDMAERDRRVFLLEEYKKALRIRANAKYVCAFAMFDDANRLLYWLLFCTNNLHGLEEMKKAMWKVDKTGNFRFSDRDNPGQLRLLDDTFNQSWLADRLATLLAGRTMTVEQIKEYVLVETPCYLFKDALRILESRESLPLQVLRAPPKRRRKTFPDKHAANIVVRFGGSESA